MLVKSLEVDVSHSFLIEFHQTFATTKFELWAWVLITP